VIITVQQSDTDEDEGCGPLLKRPVNVGHRCGNGSTIIDGRGDCFLFYLMMQEDV
jgi:hypothetical protein